MHWVLSILFPISGARQQSDALELVGFSAEACIYHRESTERCNSVPERWCQNSMEMAMYRECHEVFVKWMNFSPGCPNPPPQESGLIREENSNRMKKLIRWNLWHDKETLLLNCSKGYHGKYSLVGKLHRRQRGMTASNSQGSWSSSSTVHYAAKNNFTVMVKWITMFQFSSSRNNFLWNIQILQKLCFP